MKLRSDYADVGDDARSSKPAGPDPLVYRLSCSTFVFLNCHVERQYICNALVLQCGGYNYLWPAVSNAESGWLDIYMVRTSSSLSCSDALQWATLSRTLCLIISSGTVNRETGRLHKVLYSGDMTEENKAGA